MNHLMKSGDVYKLHRFTQYKGIIGIIYIYRKHCMCSSALHCHGLLWLGCTSSHGWIPWNMVMFHSYVNVYQGVCPLVNIQTNRISPFYSWVNQRTKWFKWSIFKFANCECLPEGKTRSWLISPVFAGLMIESTPPTLRHRLARGWGISSRTFSRSLVRSWDGQMGLSDTNDDFATRKTIWWDLMGSKINQNWDMMGILMEIYKVVSTHLPSGKHTKRYWKWPLK